MVLTRFWNGMALVKISTVHNPEEFKKWLYGQTLPVIDDDETPYDWCYADDYRRYVKRLPIID